MIRVVGFEITGAFEVEVILSLPPSTAYQTVAEFAPFMRELEFAPEAIGLIRDSVVDHPIEECATRNPGSWAPCGPHRLLERMGDSAGVPTPGWSERDRAPGLVYGEGASLADPGPASGPIWPTCGWAELPDRTNVMGWCDLDAGHDPPHHFPNLS